MSKFTPEEKLRAVMLHMEKGLSCKKIAKLIGANKSSVEDWCRNYEVFGAQAFSHRNKAHYSLQFKEACVRYYLSGKGSLRDICRLFKIPSSGFLLQWISLYNGHELKASPGGGRRIMTKGRKTTQEERTEIVAFCIEHGKDYGLTVETYKVSYQQIYAWVQKYEKKGVKGLTDRRGKAKPEDELTEEDRLRQENKILQAKIKDQEMEIALLKKLRELRGGGR